MSDETNHELLSAYLDGELADDERQRVEQLLAESAECRQIHEELCALRASLLSLPRRKLDEDLGPRVLRIAEESKPGKEDKGASERREDESIESAGGDRTAAGNVSAAERTSRRWRAIVYPVVAVAAAVAMMLNSQKEKEKKDQHDRQIARAPIGQDPPATLSAPPSESGDEESSAAGEYRRSPSKGNAAAPRISADEDYDSVSDEALGEDAAQMTEAERIVPSAGSGPAPAATGALGGMDSKSAPHGPAFAAGKRADKAESRLSLATVVVTCRLAPTAIQEKAFDALLARNHLVPWSAPAGVAGKPSSAAGQPSDNPYISLGKKGEFDDRQNKRLDRDGKHGEAESNAGKENAWAQSPWSKSVVVELDAQQLAAVLADLHSHPEQFLSVALPGQQEDNHEPALPTRPAAPAASPRGAQALSEKKPAFDAESAAESQGDGNDANLPIKSDASVADSMQPSGNATRAAGGSGSKRVRVLFRLSEAAGN